MIKPNFATRWPGFSIICIACKMICNVFMYIHYAHCTHYTYTPFVQLSTFNKHSFFFNLSLSEVSLFFCNFFLSIYLFVRRKQVLAKNTPHWREFRKATTNMLPLAIWYRSRCRFFHQNFRYYIITFEFLIWFNRFHTISN